VALPALFTMSRRAENWGLAGESYGDATDFRADEGSTAEEARAQERSEVLGDPVAAVGWIADPFGAVPDLPGIEVHEGVCSAAEVDEHGFARPPQPDFAALFPLCRCAKESCTARVSR
jgi:hypothetical protein